MVLNRDCMRAVLLQVENLRLGEVIDTKALAKKLPDFTDDDVTYACIQLQDAGYIDAIVKQYTHYQTAGVIKGVTYSGHQFLDTVRDNSQWAKVKSAAQEAGASTVKAIADIGKELATAAVSSALLH